MPSVVIGDSWVDAAAALAGNIPFIGYRVDESQLARRKLPIIANLEVLAQLPGMLAEVFGERISHSQAVP